MYLLRNFSRDHLQPISRGLMASLCNQKDAQIVLQRQRIPPDQRKPFTYYLDEVGEYFSSATLTLIEGGRKFNCGVRLFAQSLSQFDASTVDVMLDTVGTILTFSVGRKDAERLAKEIFSFSGQHLKEQSRNWLGPTGPVKYFTIQEETEGAIGAIMRSDLGQCVGRIHTIKGQQLPWFFSIPAPYYPKVPPNAVEEFRAASAKIHARPLREIYTEERRRIERIKSHITVSVGGTYSTSHTTTSPPMASNDTEASGTRDDAATANPPIVRKRETSSGRTSRRKASGTNNTPSPPESAPRIFDTNESESSSNQD